MPGDLEEAFTYYRSSHSQKRKNPVLAALPFRSVVGECKKGNVQIATEGSWWRNSIEIWNFKPVAIEDTKLWRLPSRKEEMDILYQRIRDAEISLE